MRENLIGSDSSCQDKLNNGKKFDVVLMNPPYSKSKTFLAKSLKITNVCVSIQPTAWLFGKHKNMNIVSQIDNCHCEIEIVDPSKFDATFLANVAISYMNQKMPKYVKIQNDINGNSRVYDNIEDVSELSMDPILMKFNEIVKPLYMEDNMQNHIKPNYGKYHEENINLIDKDLPIIRISVIRGNINQQNGQKCDDFYTLISNDKNEIKNKVINSTKNLDDTDKSGKRFIIIYFIICENINEQYNIVNFMKTDFCRSCLMMIKNNAHLSNGELKYIPWFDFKDPHFSKSPHEIDDWLFNKYGISDEIRKHIEEVLPDYYGIRG